MEHLLAVARERKGLAPCALLPVIVVLVSCAASPAPSSESGGHEAQEAQRISTLDAALAAGDLIVTNVHGQGASSGTVLDGTLRNTTATSIRIGVQLRLGLYLANRTASAQNMLATAVYERGGLYYLEDDEPFIEVLPHEVKEVTFKAYCLDFDLENPAAAGTYYYGACVEAVAGESDATNNYSASVQVSVTEVRAETHPDLAVGSPSVSDSSPTPGATFSLSAAVRNDGDDAAVLPFDGRGDHECRHLGGHGRSRGAFRRGDEPRVDQPDGAVVGGHVLLRRVRGRGNGGIGHDEQLL